MMLSTMCFKNNSLSTKIIRAVCLHIAGTAYFHYLTLRLGQLSSLCHNRVQRNLVHLDFTKSIELGHYIRGLTLIGLDEQEVVNT